MKKNNSESCPYSSKYSRRKFLKVLGKGAAMAMTVPFVHSFAGCDGGDGETLEKVQITKPGPLTGTAPVSIVRKSTIKEGVQRAIELAGGLGEINSGDKVVIKPNIVAFDFGERVYTHPEIIRAVIQEVKTRTDAQNITLAEASYSGPGSSGTTTNAQEAGVTDVIKDEGINFIAWDLEDSIEFVEVESPDIINIPYNIHLPKSLTDGTFDHFINIPMIKNHTWQNAGYTCCIKNFVGTMRLSNRNGSWITSSHDWNDLARGCAELNLSTPTIAMNVIDGLSIVLKGGPAGLSMTAHDANLILASKDRVAGDSLALAVLRYYAATLDIDEPYVETSVWQQPQILRAQELNLGRDRENIVVSSEDVSEINGIMNMWT